ncbi:MAG: M64 family metallopeptidase, partial [Desulfobulbaceae bacterium]|nr:M64 family metallopeptidase [Desulfobulbaceae bacterium]
HTKLMKNKSGLEVPIIEKLIIQQGQHHVRQRELITTDKQAKYIIEVHNQSGDTIFTTSFNYPRIMTVPPLPLSGATDLEADWIQIENPEVTLTLPYLPDASSVHILSPDRGSQPIFKSMEEAFITDIVHEEKKSLAVSPQENQFHLLIIASGYDVTEMSIFSSRALEVSNKLLSMEPFSSFLPDVAVYTHFNTEDLGCYCGCFGIDRLMCCDPGSVISAASGSGYYYDEIIIIHNTESYCGGGYRDNNSYKTDSYTTYTMVYDGDWSAMMAGHEFGHSFGNLCDEYTYGTEGLTYYDCVNCRENCDYWIDLTNACNLGCDVKSSYFRPDDSIMFSLQLDTYNSTSIRYSLMPRLTYFLEEIGPDIARFAVYFGYVSDSTSPIMADYDNDGDVDGSDLVILAEEIAKKNIPQAETM